jgi:hypothetical protein
MMLYMGGRQIFETSLEVHKREEDNKSNKQIMDKLLIQESPRVDEITIESRVIKKFGERGGRTVIFILRPNCFWGAVEFVLGDKKI